MKKKEAKKVVLTKACSCQKDTCTKTPSCGCEKCKSKEKTIAIFKCDIGWGNTLFIRGEKPLNWEKGKALSYNEEKQGWIFETTCKKDLEFKVLINDEHWSEGENFILHSGKIEVFDPNFL